MIKIIITSLFLTFLINGVFSVENSKEDLKISFDETKSISILHNFGNGLINVIKTVEEDSSDTNK
jgi:hypothetical protein